MREIDRDGLILCTMQGNIFEMSIERYGTSSPVFVRRFMNSRLAAAMDRDGFLDRPFEVSTAFELLDEEYGSSNYGVARYSPDVMHWIGYLYRYWTYVYEIPSKRVFRMIGSRELRDLYYAYHSLDPLNAIQRIMEAKGEPEPGDYSIERGVVLLREIRKREL